MNKIKTLTRYGRYTLLTLCGFAIWYFAAAFVLMDLNPVNWSEASRFLVLSQGLATAFGVFAFTHFKISK